MEKILEGLKVITATQSRFIEEFAILKGASARNFMRNAGKHIASHVLKYIEEKQYHKNVWLLIGKGNNGGDAYVAGTELVRQGISVRAYTLYSLEESSPLCQEMHHEFVAAGGVVCPFVCKKGCFQSMPGVILDGLLGTGFKGKVEGVLASLIAEANRSELPLFAIDVPSGLNADTGDVETVAIHATYTLCLGSAKVGFFLKKGKDYTGTISYIDFGLASDAADSVKAAAFLFNESVAQALLPPIVKTRHKYQAGYVLAVAGSMGMKGAAALSSYAALRAGAGIVRLFSVATINELPYEVLFSLLEGTDIKPIIKECARAKALLIGPGLGRAKEAAALVKKVLKQISIPCVIDADALFVLSQNPSIPLPKRSILTPHVGEAATLIAHTEKSREEDFQRYVEEHQVTLVVKGAPTWIFHPAADPLICLRGDPGMATAGSGDVLTGILAALLAQGLAPREAAALGVHLHGLAGEKAAHKLTSSCMVAGDLITYLPDAFLDCGKGIA